MLGPFGLNSQNVLPSHVQVSLSHPSKYLPSDAQVKKQPAVQGQVSQLFPYVPRPLLSSFIRMFQRVVHLPSLLFPPPIFSVGCNLTFFPTYVMKLIFLSKMATETPLLCLPFLCLPPKIPPSVWFLSLVPSCSSCSTHS